MVLSWEDVELAAATAAALLMAAAALVAVMGAVVAVAAANGRCQLMEAPWPVVEAGRRQVELPLWEALPTLEGWRMLD